MTSSSCGGNLRRLASSDERPRSHANLKAPQKDAAADLATRLDQLLLRQRAVHVFINEVIHDDSHVEEFIYKLVVGAASQSMALQDSFQ